MRGNLVHSRYSLAPILMVCLLAAGSLGIAPAANAERGGQSALKAKKVAGKKVAKLRRSDARLRLYLPIGPGSIYYDYPYYYGRGYYPKHIGGYVYYPYFYYYRSRWGYKQSPRPLR